MSFFHGAQSLIERITDKQLTNYSGLGIFETFFKEQVKWASQRKSTDDKIQDF